MMPKLILTLLLLTFLVPLAYPQGVLRPRFIVLQNPSGDPVITPSTIGIYATDIILLTPGIGTSPREVRLVPGLANETIDLNLVAGDDTDDLVRIGLFNNSLNDGWRIVFDQGTVSDVLRIQDHNANDAIIISQTSLDTSFLTLPNITNDVSIIAGDDVDDLVRLRFQNSSGTDGWQILFDQGTVSDVFRIQDLSANTALVIAQTTLDTSFQTLANVTNTVSLIAGDNTDDDARIRLQSLSGASGYTMLWDQSASALDIRDNTEGEGILLTVVGIGELLPLKNGAALGNTSFRWDAFIDDLNVVTCIGCGAAAHPVIDTTVIITGDVDPTKRILIEVDGLTTLTDRTLTVQDADYILAGTNITNEFTVSQRWSNDTKIFFEDTVGLALTMFHYDSSNNLTIGPTANAAGDGDIIFYRDGTAIAKLQEDAGVEAFTSANDLTNRIGIETSLWLRGHFRGIDLGRSVAPKDQGFIRFHTDLASVTSTLVEIFDIDADLVPDLQFLTTNLIPSTDGARSIGLAARRWDGFFDSITVNDCTGCGGELPVVDTTSIVEGSVDDTKEFRIEVDGITTGQIRVGTVPDLDFIFAGQNIDNNFSVEQGFGAANFTSTLTFTGTGNDYLLDRSSSEGFIIQRAGGDDIVEIEEISTVLNEIRFQSGSGASDDVQIRLVNSTAADGYQFVWDQSIDDLRIETHAGTDLMTLNASGITMHVPCTGCGSGSHPIPDTTAPLEDDGTGNDLFFQLSALSTARTLTVQNADYILAGTNITNSFSTGQNFTSIAMTSILEISGSGLDYFIDRSAAEGLIFGRTGGDDIIEIEELSTVLNEIRFQSGSGTSDDVQIALVSNTGSDGFNIINDRSADQLVFERAASDNEILIIEEESASLNGVWLLTDTTATDDVRLRFLNSAASNGYNLQFDQSLDLFILETHSGTDILTVQDLAVEVVDANFTVQQIANTQLDIQFEAGDNTDDDVRVRWANATGTGGYQIFFDQSANDLFIETAGGTDIIQLDIVTAVFQSQIWSQDSLPIRADAGYQDGANVGIDLTCSGGDSIINAQVSGGIIVAGSCGP